MNSSISFKDSSLLKFILLNETWKYNNETINYYSIDIDIFNESLSEARKVSFKISHINEYIYLNKYTSHIKHDQNIVITFQICVFPEICDKTNDDILKIIDSLTYYNYDTYKKFCEDIIRNLHNNEILFKRIIGNAITKNIQCLNFLLRKPLNRYNLESLKIFNII